MRRSAFLIVVPPFCWLVLFFLLPFFIVVRISLSQTALAQPPYQPLLDSGFLDFVRKLSFENFAILFSDSIYFLSAAKSLQIAALSTLILLLIGYPIAYAISRVERKYQGVLLVLIILPFWTSLLIRVYAWMVLLQREGLINNALLGLGLINEPLMLLASDFAIYLGIVYSYLPFMALPIYAALDRQDPQLLEAAADLGCPPWKAFWSITIPLSRAGIIAGSLLCFIPIVGEVIIPDLLGGSDSLMIGRTLWTEFFANRDWPLASALAILLLVVLVGPIMIYEHLQMRTLATEA